MKSLKSAFILSLVLFWSLILASCNDIDGAAYVANSELDNWFQDLFSDPSTKYNNDLALWTARLSDATEYKNEDENNTSEKIEELLREKDIKDIKSINYGDWGSSAYTLGHYRLTSGDSDTEILLIICRGSTSFFEYVGDVFKGLGEGTTIDFLGEHIWDNVHDFEEIVWSGFEEYLTEHPEIVYAPNLKVCITGHSLGGAAADAVGARLTYENRIGTRLPGNLSQESIYVYTYNAIEVRSNHGNIEEGYENIHNVYNYYDSYGPHGNLSGYGASDPEMKFGHTDIYKLKYDENDGFLSSRNHMNYVTAIEQNLVTCNNKTHNYEAHDVKYEVPEKKDEASDRDTDSSVGADSIIDYMGYFYDPYKAYQHYGKAYDFEGNLISFREDGKNAYSSQVFLSMGRYFIKASDYNMVGAKEYLFDFQLNVLKEIERQDVADDFQKSDIRFVEIGKGNGMIRVGYEYYDMNLNKLQLYGKLNDNKGGYLLIEDPADDGHYMLYDSDLLLLMDLRDAHSVELLHWDVYDETYLVVDMGEHSSSGEVYSDVTVINLKNGEEILRVLPGEARYEAYTYNVPGLMFDQPNKNSFRIVMLYGGEVALDINLPYEGTSWPWLTVNQGTGRVEIKHGFYDTIYDVYDLKNKCYVTTSNVSENLENTGLPKFYYKNTQAYIRSGYPGIADAQSSYIITTPENYEFGGLINFDLFNFLFEKTDRWVFIGRRLEGVEWKECLFDGKTGDVLFEMREGAYGPFVDNYELAESVFIFDSDHTETNCIIYNIITGEQVEVEGKLIAVDGCFITIEESDGTLRVYNYFLDSFVVE